jgi:nicotinate phosphoribosyltransferase
MSDIKVTGLDNCSLALGNEPLLTFEGSLDKVQLIETTMLNLTNYPSLIASLANRLRRLYGNDVVLVEDGSKYAQTSVAGMLGIKYGFIGGVDMTTNLYCAKRFNIPLFKPTVIVDNEINDNELIDNGFDLLTDLRCHEFFPIYGKKIKQILYSNVAFKTVKQTTYKLEDVNEFELFLSVTKILHKMLKEVIVIVSLSVLEKVDSKFKQNHLILKVAVKYDPQMLKHKIDYNFDIILLGGDFIVSSTQPALGMVYKIMEINDQPCIKFSEEKSKQTIPGKKSILRLFDENFTILSDYLHLENEKTITSPLTC